jgi:nucleoside-diphosphate kinase
VHRERPFFKALVEFMISGPVHDPGAGRRERVLKNRDLMGATNPKDAAPGTIRADFADASTPTPCMARTARNCRRRNRYFFAATEVTSR